MTEEWWEETEEWWDEVDEVLNHLADQHLGTVIAVLDGEGRSEEALQLEPCRIIYEAIRDYERTMPTLVKARIDVDPLLLGTITDEIVQAVERVLAGYIRGCIAGRPGLLQLAEVTVVPEAVPLGWREGRAQARLLDIGPHDLA